MKELLNGMVQGEVQEEDRALLVICAALFLPVFGVFTFLRWLLK